MPLRAEYIIMCKPNGSAQSAHVCEFHVLVGNVGGGAIADYGVIEAFNNDDDRRQATLIGYPRWSENEGLLIARALDALDKSDAKKSLPEAAGIDEIHCALYLEGSLFSKRYLSGWALYTEDSTLELVDADKQFTSKKVTLLPCKTGRELLLQAQCLAARGSQKLPAWPAPLDVPVHDSAGTKYVRMTEIPEPAMSIFAYKMRFSTCPVIEDDPDPSGCVFLWDWEDFLAGRR